MKGSRNRRNYYRVLQVQPDAPEAVIRASYRTLMQKLRVHPDLGGDAAEAALLNEAYRTLSDPALRARYDAEVRDRLFPRRPGAGSASASGGATPSGERPVRPGPGFVAQCPICDAVCAPGVYGEPRTRCARCSSPLTTAPEILGTDSGRRRLARIPAREPVLYWAGWPEGPARRGLMRDVSPRGMHLGVDEPCEAGQRLRLEGARLAAAARVVAFESAPAAERPPWSLRLEFLTVSFVAPRGSFVHVQA